MSLALTVSFSGDWQHFKLGAIIVHEKGQEIVSQNMLSQTHIVTLCLFCSTLPVRILILKKGDTEGSTVVWGGQRPTR